MPKRIGHLLARGDGGKQGLSSATACWAARLSQSRVSIRDTDMQRKQARWHGVRGALLITPLIHANQLEAMLHTRIHILRYIMQVCWDEDDLPRTRLREPCLTLLQLSERMQFTDKEAQCA